MESPKPIDAGLEEKIDTVRRGPAPPISQRDCQLSVARAREDSPRAARLEPEPPFDVGLDDGPRCSKSQDAQKPLGDVAARERIQRDTAQLPGARVATAR